jgi:adenylosuccinate synthase
MSNTILVGAQWGDEGKGKIIDVLTERADVVVRTQGGNNAGHTVHIKGQKYILHLVPSGILRPGKTCVIGNGVVVDPVSLVDEIEHLRKLGVKVEGNLYLSETAHVVLPYHRELDAQREILKGKNKIGTTKRGIGPAYGDKAARTGLRVVDLVHAERFESKLRFKIKENNEVLKAFGAKPLSFNRVHVPGHRPRHLPIRHLVEHHCRGRLHRVGRAAPSHGPGGGCDEGLHDSCWRRTAAD